MPQLAINELTKKTATLAAMKIIRQPWWTVWRDIGDYYMPMKCAWLMSQSERTSSARNMTNPMILDGTGTLAARTLAAGLMNGIASPARPWFKLRLVGFEDDLSQAARVWLDEVERRMRYVIAESNFYNVLGQFFLDLSLFSTAAFTIYEDDEKVFHCQNHAIGEYYIDLDNRLRPCTFGREYNYTVQQLVQEFGLENCSQTVRSLYTTGGASLLKLVLVNHLIEPNVGQSGVPKSFEYREYYWEAGSNDGKILREKGYHEKPVVIARWEVNGNDPYGVGPGMDGLGDVKQLQHETKKKAQGMDKMVSPPILADIILENSPLGLLPNGVTYVPHLDATNGAKPIYEVNLPVAEMTQDIIAIQQRIRDTFYNFLFNKVTNLSTVRSAREIDAIEGEKLVLLGSVLERFENEGLDPAINRIFNIMLRKGLLPPAPVEIQNANIQIQYVSIIASAQSAAGTTAIERWLQFGGNLVQVWPEIREVPEIVDVFSQYGKDLGVSARSIRTREAIAAIVDKNNQDSQANQQLQQAGGAAEIGKTLSETDVGGGANALQRVLSGARAA